MTLSTPAFLTRLASLGLTPCGFAAESGANPKSVRLWAAGDAPIPRWVPRMLELLALPGAMAPPAALGRARTGDGRFTPTETHAP